MHPPTVHQTSFEGTQKNDHLTYFKSDGLEFQDL